MRYPTELTLGAPGASCRDADFQPVARWQWSCRMMKMKPERENYHYTTTGTMMKRSRRALAIELYNNFPPRYARNHDKEEKNT